MKLPFSYLEQDIWFQNLLKILIRKETNGFCKGYWLFMVKNIDFLSKFYFFLMRVFVYFIEFVLSSYWKFTIRKVMEFSLDNVMLAIPFRYMTDGGLNLYTRSLNRVPDTAASRDVIQRGVHDVTVDADR